HGSCPLWDVETGTHFIPDDLLQLGTLVGSHQSAITQLLFHLVRRRPTSHYEAVYRRRQMVTATRVHIACNRATARCIASTSAAGVSSFPLLHIPLKAAPSSMIILS